MTAVNELASLVVDPDVALVRCENEEVQVTVAVEIAALSSERTE